ncbi:C-terminal processing peptidase family protein [Lysobacter antibioticus]|uniref:C-terminal processing peptidase family protein n=1 Tax=Lysobacter antibioticus TaxID=84531 RepID=A0A0S2DZE9_LYSAN|nr:carboxy terminal-processing peptidase [Lysobacter antibioticus]ALN63897.1 C-terminal processing peptidase family protein [Lysobacter antibioticus]ALN79011.1 C-terminal processing peptidase family protein [Lysobacter antibioticus]
MTLKNKRAVTLLAGFLLTAPLALLARPDAVSAPKASTALPSAPTADQTTAAKLVYGLLSDSRYAYRPRALDDALSADMYKRYLESLDGGKQFFSAVDIARFDASKNKLDDAIKSGDLSPAYAIFATYKQRVDERVAYARGLLKQPAGFEFTGNDRYDYDRKDAPWVADTAALDALWKQSVRNDWLRLKLAGKKPEDIAKTLDKRYANMAKGIAELKGEDVFQTFVNSYANAIDPHTDYLTPKSADNFNMTMSLSLDGIGAQLQKQDDVVAIREVIPGGPAARSNLLKAGDRIVGVGQGDSGAMEDVIGWRIDDVVAKIRGAKGTKVRLDVVPAESGLDSKPNRIVLVRDKVRLEDQAAKSEVIDIPAAGDAPAKRIGVIKLPGFYQDFEGRRKNANDYASATRDVAKLLTKLRGDKVDGVVLDLRNNGGGSLNEAIELTGLFIDRGPVVQVRESGGRVSVEGDSDTGIAWEGPLAVLINRGSASASEIFAGAIQDYGRGLVIGETTFGKGTVQNLVDLDRWPANEGPRFGQVKLTIAQFFRVSGGSTQNKGVVPDLAFPVSVDATEYGESTYDNALPWTKIAAVPHTSYGNFAPLLPKLETLHSSRIAGDKEFQWWSQDVAQFREERAKKWISLNEAERRAERDRDDVKRKQRQAERKQLGLELDPLADDANDDGLAAAERDIAKDAAREKLAEKRPDPLLRESASILADAVRLLNNDRQLSAQVLPTATMPGHWAD